MLLFFLRSIFMERISRRYPYILSSFRMVYCSQFSEKSVFMDIRTIYHASVPDWLLPFLEVPEMRRLKDVGMNCGCEYTSLPPFRKIHSYSRWDHSVGTALIVWHFTEDPQQTLSALFHDISTPAFAHSVDFLRGDHQTQEATESGTLEMIRSSSSIQALLRPLGLTAEDVGDYHRFPIADNVSPRLCADRLEYSCGNIIQFDFASAVEVRSLVEDLAVGKNEDGEDELIFSSMDAAVSFARLAMKCSHVYVSDGDRYAMQTLADLLWDALQDDLISLEDLYTTESRVISTITASVRYRERWEKFCSLSAVLCSDQPDKNEGWRIIPSKKRYIDPFVLHSDRVSSKDADFALQVRQFLEQSLDHWVRGI